jgi:hypothetical protein
MARRTGIEKLGSGQWQLVISEIPYMVQKGKLIEQLAALIADKKLPILEDVRDESDTQIRIVLVPKTRNIEPDLLKESVYKLTELESRFSLNLNVLDAQRTPACWAAPAAAAMGGQPDRHPAAPQPASSRQDRGAAGAGRRLYHCVPESRPRDRDHPHRG